MRRFDWLFGGLVRLVDCCEVNEKVGAAQLFRRIVSVIVILFFLKLRIESRVFPQGRGERGVAGQVANGYVRQDFRRMNRAFGVLTLGI